ncbi:MAG: Methylthioribose-1-phosphate isomerase [Betaproteobacteria bacterium ADurb.Bin341]|nr:MAG: Methylthioribose-1-phosphate isomerase [Betaproteobacteria bacterium ADurb.Bin341]
MVSEGHILIQPSRIGNGRCGRIKTMKINGIPTRSLWPLDDQRVVKIIDQTALPHHFRTLALSSLDECADAIRSMKVRGAPLIGATAAYGIALAMTQSSDDTALAAAVERLAATRPTAINLDWALRRMEAHLLALPTPERAEAAWLEATAIAEEDVAQNRAIGQHGLALFGQILQVRHQAQSSDHKPLQIMTHCNAGWLATVDHGTALSPIYAAFDAGIDVHVWVSETRPRNQGLLTAWELKQHGVPYTVIADNAAGLLLMRGEVDAVIVGADRIARNGDVANKVGTTLKALAAKATDVPFYVAAPRSTLDFASASGNAIPIEEREGDELRLVTGLDPGGQPASLRQLPAEEAVANPAFDVTPAALITALITERGTCPASAAGLAALYPEETHG